MTWLPIETAPMDGTLIRLSRIDGNWLSTQVAFYGEYGIAFPVNPQWVSGCSALSFIPTHWQPIPPPAAA